MKTTPDKAGNTDQPAKKTYQDYNNQKPVRNDPHFTETDAGAAIPETSPDDMPETDETPEKSKGHS